MKKIYSIVALLVMLTASAVSYGQAISQNGGSIQGTVTDPTGAAIPGATVVIADPATGYTHSLTTDGAGYYSLGPLNPGNYTITISAGSFQNLKVSTVVHTGTVTSGSEKLSLGKATETVEVNAGELQVNVDQIGVSGIVTREEIDSLPIDGRNILDIAQIQPGVILQEGMSFDPTKAGYSAISVDGIGGRTTRILLDGQDITDETVGTTIFNVPSGAVDEVQLNRSTQDVSGEVTSTGQVLVSTQSGTNSYHGNLFYNFQDARAGFANDLGANAPFQRNQFGGYAGGAIIKDKLFFFGGAERLKQNASEVANSAQFADITALFPYVPAPFRDTFSIARLDYNAPWGVHLFVRGAYSVNADGATFGLSPYSVYLNRDNVPAIVGGADFTTGKFSHSLRFGYEKFHNLLEDETAALGGSIYNPSTSASNQVALTVLGADPGGFQAGPNFLAPQQTYQSDKQFRYDGTWTKGSHNIKFGGEMNRILGGGFAEFFGAALDAVFIPVTGLQVPCYSATPYGGVDGSGNCGGDPTNGYAADEYFIGNGNSLFSERPGFGLSGGGVFSWRFAGYLGDTWKVKPYLTVTAGVRWSVDTDRANQDLPTPLCSSVDPSLQFAGCTGNTPLFDQYQAGLGAPVHQPYGNFGPQLGAVYSPGSHKLSVRVGGGIYYESDVFNNTGNARGEEIQKAGAYQTQGVAVVGVPNVFLPGIGEVTNFNNVTGAPCTTGANCVNIGTVTTESIAQASPQINALKSYYQSKVKGAIIANPSYIGTGYGLEADNLYAHPYVSPYSIQLNAGVQRELFKGFIVSADYLRVHTLKVPIDIDVNHVGAARTLNPTAAQNAITATTSSFGCTGGATAAAINCAIANGASIADFSGNGLDSGDVLFGGAAASAYGATPATGAAFAGTNPNVGEGLFIIPGGRSQYDALQIVLQQQKAHPAPGIVSSNMQFSYSLSRSVTSTGTDQFFAGAKAFDNDNPDGFIGRSSLDHTNELSFGGSLAIKYGAQVGFIGHFFSAPPSTLTLDATAGSATQIFKTDLNGDGTTSGSLLPGTKAGAYMHQIKTGGLNQAINNYNALHAGQLTPAGQALVSANLFTQQQLVALGAVQQQIAAASPLPLANPAFRDFDLNVSYPIKKWLSKYHEGLSIVPGIAMYNVFNMANFSGLNGTLLNTADAGTPGYVNGPNTYGGIPVLNSNRAERGTGTFAQGAPRSTEYQLKVTF